MNTSISDALTRPVRPYEYEDTLTDAVHKQALVLLLRVPDGVQRAAITAYADAAGIDATAAEYEVADLGAAAARHPMLAGLRLAAFIVVTPHIEARAEATGRPETWQELKHDAPRVADRAVLVAELGERAAFVLINGEVRR